MGPATVLLVDDDLIVLKIHEAAVKSFGFATQIALSADEAIDRASKQDFSMVISDVQMPGEGGFDFVRRLGQEGLKTMPVVFLTGYDDIDILRGGLRAGGDDFLLKGTSIDVLRSRIAFWMASGFNGMPRELRRRALLSSNKMKGDDFPGLLKVIERSELLPKTTAKQLEQELSELPDDFGNRLIEKICILGRASKLLIDQSQSVEDYIRFADYLYTALSLVRKDWMGSMSVMLAQFDSWTKDPRFLMAASVPLKGISQYSSLDS